MLHLLHAAQGSVVFLCGDSDYFSGQCWPIGLYGTKTEEIQIIFQDSAGPRTIYQDRGDSDYFSGQCWP